VKAKTSLMLLLAAFVSHLAAYEIYHHAPEQFLQGVPGQLEVFLPDYLDQVDHVKLFLRPNGQSVYEELQFYPLEGAWFCDIPAAYMNTDTLAYFISASFGPAGFAALPAQQPDQHPFRVPLLKFSTKNKRYEPKLIKEAVESFKVVPWKPTPQVRLNRFPVIYIPKPNSAFVESGYIKIVGTRKATAEDLLRSMLYLCLEENADAITSLNYSLLAEKPSADQLDGHIELEGVYLRRAAKK
jgi:hypothetical protein